MFVSFFPAIVSFVFIFPPSAPFPKNSLCLVLPAGVVFIQPRCSSGLYIVCVWVNEGKKRLWSCVTLWVLQSLFVFRSTPQQYPTLPLVHTLSPSHCAHSSLRKQATAITTAQTEAALCRKTCAHFPGSWLTDHCPFIHYSTWKSPKSQENNPWHFLAPLHKPTLWL